MGGTPALHCCGETPSRTQEGALVWHWDMNRLRSHTGWQSRGLYWEGTPGWRAGGEGTPGVCPASRFTVRGLTVRRLVSRFSLASRSDSGSFPRRDGWIQAGVQHRWIPGSWEAGRTYALPSLLCF